MKLTGFYLFDPTKNAFVALDSGSGGYPYMVETLYKAQQFHTVADAMKYRKSSLSGNYQNANAWKAVTLEVVVTEAENILSWNVVFNANNKQHGYIGNAFDVASQAGYPFMMWNDRIYNVDTRKEVVGAYVS